MKKLLAIACSMMLLLGMMIPVSAISSNGAVISVASVTDLDIENETTVNICINIENNPGLSGGILLLAFDEDAFKYKTAKAGDGLGNNCSFTKPSAASASSPLKLVFDGMDPNTDEDKVDDTMVTITFTLLDGIKAGTTYDFTLSAQQKMFMTDDDYEAIDYDDIVYQSGTVKTKGGAPAPTAKTVTYSATNGSVIASLTELSEGTPVASGTITTAAADSAEVYFYFFPNKGYTATGMTVNGEPVIGTDGGRKFTITEDKTFNFEFAAASGTSTVGTPTVVATEYNATIFGQATNASSFGAYINNAQFAADGADGDGYFAIELSSKDGNKIFNAAKTYTAKLYADSVESAEVSVGIAQ